MKARYVVRSAVVHGKYIRHSSFRLIKLETIILLFKQVSLKSKPKCRSQKQARKKYRERRNTASDQQGKKEQHHLRVLSESLVVQVLLSETHGLPDKKKRVQDETRTSERIPSMFGQQEPVKKTR